MEPMDREEPADAEEEASYKGSSVLGTFGKRKKEVGYIYFWDRARDGFCPPRAAAAHLGAMCAAPQTQKLVTGQPDLVTGITMDTQGPIQGVSAKRKDQMGQGQGRKEYYGFAIYIGTTLGLVVYLVWAFFPREWLHAMNVYYYPSRWWAIAVPSFVVMTIVYIYVAIARYNIEGLTRPLNSLELVTDSASKVVGRGESERYLHEPSAGVWDLPTWQVCEVLYGQTDNDINA